jgi:nucleoside-diphosphate-sugar epimerase
MSNDGEERLINGTNESLMSMIICGPAAVEPSFGPERPGDIRQSYADISRATDVLGYRPTVGLAEGLRATFAWYRDHGSRF